MPACSRTRRYVGRAGADPFVQRCWTAADHTARRSAIQRRSRVHQSACEVRGAGQEVLWQADQLRASQEQRTGPREGLFRVHEPGHLCRLRHRFAGAYVDVLQGSAVHRCAIPLPRPRPLEQGPRRRHAQTRRRRSRGERRRDADRLCGRRHAQHFRQQAGAQHGGNEGPQGPRSGRADLEQDVRRGRHVADGDRLRRDLQRHPERRDPGRRERSCRRGDDEVLRSRPEPQHDSRSSRPTCRPRSSRRARKRASTVARSNRARIPPSSTRWKRPGSSRGFHLPTERR